MGFWDKVMENPYDRNPFHNNKKDSSSGPRHYQPDAWRSDIPYNDPFDSHMFDSGLLDRDGDGYVDGSVGDSGLWDK